MNLEIKSEELYALLGRQSVEILLLTKHSAAMSSEMIALANRLAAKEIECADLRKQLEGSAGGT